MLALFCTFFMATAVQAKPTMTVIDFSYKMIVSGEAERWWFSDDGIYQARNTPHIGWVVDHPDFSGNFTYIGDVTLDFATYNGRGGGYFELYNAEYNGLPAGFVGKMHFKIVGGHLTGTFNCFGTGSLQGHLKGTIEGWLGVITNTATLIIWN